jgi:hypothetical protein
MFSRHMLMLMMLGGAVALPYLTSSEFQHRMSGHEAPAVVTAIHGEPDQGHTTATHPSPSETHAASGDSHAARPVSHGPQAVAVAPLRRTQSSDLGQIVNFDVNPAWVLSNWPRVSAGLAELDLQGYRVPLVSGTQEDDLAGSLTYYFDREQRVARITFTGSTGDPRKLIALLTSRFGFMRETSDDPSVIVYDVKWNNKPRSELKVRPVRIVRAEDPHGRYDVELSIKRF